MGLSLGTLMPLRWRLWLGKRLFASLGPSTVRVSWHRVIKGPCDPPEIEAMQYVASHTDVPIPRTYAIHTQGNLIYIEMAYVPGDDLDSVWDTLTSHQRTTIFDDIKQHISALRGLKSPAEDIVCSALQNPAYDGRIGARFLGPLNHHDFHSLTRGHLRKEDIREFLGEEVEYVHTKAQYQTHFTHADLAPRNIIVRHGRVVAIIDWGYSGWYPEYWEFTKAHYNYFSGQDWEDYIRLAIPPYETELVAEQILSDRLPEPGTPATSTRGAERNHRPGSRPSEVWLKGRAIQPRDLWALTLSKDNIVAE